MSTSGKGGKGTFLLLPSCASNFPRQLIPCLCHSGVKRLPEVTHADDKECKITHLQRKEARRIAPTGRLAGHLYYVFMNLPDKVANKFVFHSVARRYKSQTNFAYRVDSPTLLNSVQLSTPPRRSKAFAAPLRAVWQPPHRHTHRDNCHFLRFGNDQHRRDAKLFRNVIHAGVGPRFAFAPTPNCYAQANCTFEPADDFDISETVHRYALRYWSTVGNDAALTANTFNLRLQRDDEELPDSTRCFLPSFSKRIEHVSYNPKVEYTCGLRVVISASTGKTARSGN